jgi:hypothetical protein
VKNLPHITVTQLIRDLRFLLKKTGKADLPIGIISEVDERGVLLQPILAIGGIPTPTSEGQPALLWVSTEGKINAIRERMPNAIRDWSDLLWRN